MPEFFDYDPMTGISHEFEAHEDGRVTVYTKQDIEPILDYCKAIRNDEEISRRGIKEEWWAYAKIPPIVQLQLRQKGIDINNKDHAPRYFREINENYPWLKLTTKKHAVKHG